jgi:hypothetical protein
VSSRRKQQPREIDVGAWQRDERRALVDLIRAKGGRSEQDYVARYLRIRSWMRHCGSGVDGRANQQRVDFTKSQDEFRGRLSDLENERCSSGRSR